MALFKLKTQKLFFVICTITLAFMNFEFVNAQSSGDVDLTFNTTDFGFGHGDGVGKLGTGSYELIYDAALQSDGKIIIGGDFTRCYGTYINNIARINPNGSLDASFVPFSYGSQVHCLAIQSDGKILAGGGSYIVRYNADGSSDDPFNTLAGSVSGTMVNKVAVQSDGKIIIVGAFTSYKGTPRANIARLNADGTLDTSFDPGSGANNYINDLAIQSDGKILIGGYFTDYNGTSRSRIARLNGDGSLDLSFDPGTGVSNYINRITILSNNKILIGGNFFSYNGTSISCIAQLNADGTLDPSFNPGSGTNSPINEVEIQSDGKLLIGGDFTTFNGTSKKRIARLNADGSLDNTFIGTGTNDVIWNIVLQSNGKIMLAGKFNICNGQGVSSLAWLNTDGSPDLSTDQPTGASKTVKNIVTQPDGKILIVGSFSSYFGTPMNYLARLDANGSLDPSFNVGGTGPSYPYYESGFVNCAALQADGKILIGGYFTQYNGTSRQNIARLNSDGSLDNSFNPGISTGLPVNKIIVQADGKIIIVGAFSSYDGTSRAGIARINTDGTLDLSFNPGTGIGFGEVWDAILQDDGKVIIVGNFSVFNGTPRDYIVRINTDGTLDQTLNPKLGCGAKRIFKITLQNDGKILLAGDKVWDRLLMRLNADGTMDTLFTPQNGSVQYTIYSVSIQNDNKIIIGGIQGIDRFNIDGTIDASFNPGQGVNNTVFATAVQNDGKVLLGGDFTSYNGVGRNRIARFLQAPASEILLEGNNKEIFDGDNAPSAIDSSYFGNVCTSSFRTVTYKIKNTGNLPLNITLPINISGIAASDYSIVVDPITFLAAGDSTFFTIKFIPGAIGSRSATISIDNDDPDENPFNFDIAGNGGTGNSFSTQTVSACTSYTWNGATYSNSGTYNMTIPNVAGCDSVMTLNLAIDNVPSTPGSITGNTTICSGTMSTYNITAVNGATSYTWVSPSGWSGTSISNSIDLISNSTGGDLFVTANNSCGVSPTQSLTINVNALPVVTANTTATTVCAGTLVTLTGGGASSYSWTGGVINGAAFVPSSTTTYAVTGTDANSCVNSASITVIVHDLPNVTANATATAVCAGTSVTLTGGGAVSYSWTGGVIDGETFVPSSTTSYTVTGTDINNCTNTASKTITVNALPNVATSVNGFTISATLNGASYQWIDCNNNNALIPNQTSQSFTAAANGNYAVIVTKNGCSDTSACVVINTIGINKLGLINPLKIYPNPNNGMFTLSAPYEGEYQIINELGQSIQSIQLSATNKYSVTIENLSTGVYYIIGLNKNETIRQKIVVTK